MPNVQGGVRTFVTNLCERLASGGAFYKVIEYCFTEALDNCKTHDRRTSQYLISRYATFKAQANYLASEIKNEDILICNDSFELEVIDALQLRNPIVFILHGDLVHYANTMERFRRIIDHIICVSTGLRLKYQPGFPEINFSVSTPFVVGRSVREHTMLSDRLRCIFVGRFEYMKGADLFIELVNCMGETETRWTVICPLDGNDVTLLKLLPGYVQLCQGLSNQEVLYLLSENDVLIFPSRSEGFGLVVLEAMTHGVVPIALDIPIGIPDQVKHGCNGFIVSESNWDEALKILAQLNKDRSVLKKMKEQAVEYSLNHFNPHEISLAFLLTVTAVMAKANKRFGGLNSDLIQFLCPEFLYRRLKKAKQMTSTLIEGRVQRR